MRSLFLLLMLATPALAQKKATSFADVADVTAVFEPAKAKPGETVVFKFTISPKARAWTYPTTTGKNQFQLPTTGDVVFSPSFTDPPGAEPSLDGEEHYTSAVTWQFTGTVSPTATAGRKKIALAGTKVQACNDQKCFNLNAATPPTAELEVLPGAVAPPPATPPGAMTVEPPVLQAPPKTVTPPPPSHKGGVKKAAISPDQHRANLNSVIANLEKGGANQPVSGGSIWAFLVTGAAWGWISLVTPCVFPMIPITVSLFLKQGNKSPGQVLKLASVYSLTIIAVIGLSAFVALGTFRSLSVNPWMNIGLGVLLLVFSLSLFGMFDIALPGFLLRYTEKKRGSGGMLGTVFGAIAFSIVSFTCVAPFLGGFAGMAASNKVSDLGLIAGALAFATAFASPFFVLALFPTLIKKLPKSGGWLDTIKAVMGFVEVAAALKFFRTAELRLLSPTEYFTFDLCLAGLIVVAILSGLYLLNVFRLPHDEERPNIGVGRLMWAMGLLGFAVYLMPGLLKTSDGQNQRPNGVVYAWIEAFLLPESVPGVGLPWDSDLSHALDTARQSTDGPRLVFVDFTGTTCQNCRLNERDVFSKSEIDELLRQFVLAQLYTDEIPTEFYHTPPSDADRSAEAAANAQFQSDAFDKNESLPFYAILKPLPNGKVVEVGRYGEGKINDRAAFAAFLTDALKKK
ncbi:protein-disulfide reductase DsbD family protein [Limnoglobus roseus]|uniref:Thiol:disulfide interchange protein DsbD 2 n=1 Tax=Limnoglobus roseus TaxID=2598579 RepID=A0A5C1AM02_9BACT|nr:cytochrome c biogenesis protein CcdA [Limnoglobus roseus]QEL18204.1 thiol:disulfide interchange protein DsbD 2 [Limnoglobus roseus]